MMDYAAFLDGKCQLGERSGFDPIWMPGFLYPFQAHLTDWNVRMGRSGTMADCGMGKTPMQLVWAENVVRKTNRSVLIVTPLAVSFQTIREAEKFGIEAEHCRDGKAKPGSRIVVTNYERLHYFDRSRFLGMCCDESSILKNFQGATKDVVTDFMRKMPYRLLCTATPSPNDYIELGTSSEALGYLGYMDMLGMFFKNDQNSMHPTTGRGCFEKGKQIKSNAWRFKRHAERSFWRWVCSWSRACRRPSDLGYDDDGFVLPALIERENIVNASRSIPGRFVLSPAVGLYEQRQERRQTIRERCEKAAELAKGPEAVVIWCHLNVEGDLLERLIPGCEQVSGRDSDESKEEKFMAFSSGQIKCLVTKPKIGGFGLNWQHCHRVIDFPSHS